MEEAMNFTPGLTLADVALRRAADGEAAPGH